METINAQEIKRLRLEKNWTQLDLARRVGISEQSLNKIEKEKANPRASTIRKILLALSENSDKSSTKGDPTVFAEQVEANLLVSHLREENSRLVDENRKLTEMLSKSQGQLDSLLTMLAKPKGSPQTRTSHPLHRSKMRQVACRVTLPPAR